MAKFVTFIPCIVIDDCHNYTQIGYNGERRGGTLHLGRLRQRGPSTVLADSEVITIELVGEFWKPHTDNDPCRHFRLYHKGEFPTLARLLQHRLAERLVDSDPLW